MLGCSYGVGYFLIFITCKPFADFYFMGLPTSWFSSLANPLPISTLWGWLLLDFHHLQTLSPISTLWGWLLLDFHHLQTLSPISTVFVVGRWRMSSSFCSWTWKLNIFLTNFAFYGIENHDIFCSPSLLLLSPFILSFPLFYFFWIKSSHQNE